MVKAIIGVVSLVVILIIIGAIYLVIHPVNKIGDIRPAILPIKSNSAASSSTTVETSVSKKGQSLQNALKISDGFTIGIFAKDISNARDIEITPKNTVIVSSPSTGEVIGLKDDNNDGVADRRNVLLKGLIKPHGIAVYNNKLFVAEETRIARYTIDEDLLILTKDKDLFSLPKGGRHFTRTIVFNKSGQMFVSIGSSCDVCNEKDPFLASVIVSDSEGNNQLVYAKGLRNAPFITINRKTDQLYSTEMGRDFLGDDAPPDEIDLLEDGKDYGWPICYGDNIHDTSFDKNIYKSDPCANKTKPLYKIQAHSAPLGLQFIDSVQFPTDWQGDLLVSYHGSWNRSIPVGYKVVRMHHKDNQITGEEDFLTNFLSGTQTTGRPVDLAFDSTGYLYLSDDKAGVIYIIGKK